MNRRHCHRRLVVGRDNEKKTNSVAMNSNWTNLNINLCLCSTNLKE